MALDRRRIYFNAVLGGLGGLAGWAGSVLVSGAVTSSSLYVRDVFVGLTIGACIGAALGCTEGLIESPSWFSPSGIQTRVPSIRYTADETLIGAPPSADRLGAAS